MANHFHHGGGYGHDHGHGYGGGYGHSGSDKHKVVVKIPSHDKGYDSPKYGAPKKNVRVKVKRPKKKRPSYHTHSYSSHAFDDLKSYGDHHGGGYDDHHYKRKDGLYDEYVEYEELFDSFELRDSKKGSRRKKNQYVRVASREIERSSPIIDSGRLFRESYEEEHLELGDVTWHYPERESDDKWKHKKYRKQRSHEKSSRHEKRDIFKSWEDARKAVYKPYVETHSGESGRNYDRNHQYKRRRKNEDRYPVMWKTSRDNSGQYSAATPVVASMDGEPRLEVGDIPGFEWSLEPSNRQ